VHGVSPAERLDTHGDDRKALQPEDWREPARRNLGRPAAAQSEGHELGRALDDRSADPIGRALARHGCPELGDLFGLELTQRNTLLGGRALNHLEVASQLDDRGRVE
jgi:hypothetical protein